MHKLFPEKFPEGDELGTENWNYEWACERTGTKWFPIIDLDDWSDEEALLRYDTAWGPNNGTLQRLHELTGWSITNEYEEPMMMFE